MSARGKIALLAFVVIVGIALYGLRDTPRTDNAHVRPDRTSASSPELTAQPPTRLPGNEPAPVQTSTSAGTAESPTEQHRAPVVYDGVTNWVMQMSLAERLTKQLESRRVVSEDGNMQDVARREAEISERVRMLRKGMTVNEAVRIMGSPDGISMIDKETTIEVALPPGVLKDAVDRPESGYEVQTTLVPGDLDDALEHPELVYQLIYTPYEQQKKLPNLAGHVNMKPPPGPYKVFVLRFRSFAGKIQNHLLEWTEPFEDELSRAGQEQ